MPRALLIYQVSLDPAAVTITINLLIVTAWHHLLQGLATDVSTPGPSPHPSLHPCLTLSVLSHSHPPSLNKRVVILGTVMHSVTCLLQGRRGRRWSQSPFTTCCSSRRRWIHPQRRSSHEVLVLEGQGLLSQRRERACDQVTRPSRLYLGTAHVAICQSVTHPLFICPLHKPPSILSSIHILFLPPSLHPSLPPSIVLPPLPSITLPPLPSIFTYYPLVLSVADPKPRVPCSIGSPVRAGGYAPRLWEI